MLKSILVVTFAVARLQSVETAYENYLGYESVDSGVVSAQEAGTWGAPASAGRPYLLMQPASGEPVYLRFVESDPVDGYAPMRTLGWNATELLAPDPDAVAAKLRDSPFEIVGEPADLWDAPNAPRAMQAVGPSGELLYLTRNVDFEMKTFVDRVFIMVVGGPSMAAFRDFYGDRLGLKVSDATPFQIGVISKTLGVPMETTYPLALATVSPRFLIELDEYPDVAKPRQRNSGALPPGVAMVTFIVTDLGAFDLDWRGAPAVLDGLPYAGRRSAVTVGPAGEWIELVEDATAAAESPVSAPRAD